MAMRVRKLARELRGTPGELLGLLHELGLERYRSPEDMLSTAVVDKVRKAWGKGVRGAPVAVQEAPRAPNAPAGTPVNDLMSRLVPGVVPRAGRRRKKPPRSVPVDAPVEAVAAPTSAEAELERRRREILDAVEREREAVAAERDAIHAERAAVEAEAEALEGRVAVLEAQRDALHREREGLARSRADLEARTVPTLADLLVERGLRGADEFERALLGLGGIRLLRELIPHLEVSDRVAVAELLHRALLLVGGEVPEGLLSGVVGVRVAPERGELPGWDDLRRELGRAAELLMLHGLRHVAVCGAPPGWHRLIREAFDPRIELRFLPPGVTEGGEERKDALIHWDGRGGSPDLDERPVVIHAGAADLVAFARAVREALEVD